MKVFQAKRSWSKGWHGNVGIRDDKFEAERIHVQRQRIIKLHRVFEIVQQHRRNTIKDRLGGFALSHTRTASYSVDSNHKRIFKTTWAPLSFIQVYIEYQALC